MGSIGGPEILIVLVVALIVLGPKRLPQAARQVGRAVSEFRRVTSDFQAEVRDALNEPVTTTQPTDARPARTSGTTVPPQPGSPTAGNATTSPAPEDADGASFI